jgi:hypothetical protein
MGKWLEKYATSVRFWIMLAVAIYLGYALYFMVYGLQFSIQLSQDQYVWSLISKNSLWWQVIYYTSEGITGSIAIVLRAFAASFAFYAAYLYWRKKDIALPSIRKNVARALLLEAGFFLAIIPSIMAAFSYNLTSEYLFYFDHTPERIVLFGTAIPILAIVLVVPPLLLKLRSKVKVEAPMQDVLKWSALTGLSYIFVVFWLNYCMLWVANMVPYTRPNQLYGLDFLLEPLNFVSFAATAFGLLAIGVAGIVTLRPALKKEPTRVNLTYLGAVMVAFGGYFLFNTIYYFLTGGFEAHPSVWYEVISPMHNPNLWAMSLIVVGVPLIIQGRVKKTLLFSPPINDS